MSRKHLTRVDGSLRLTRLTQLTMGVAIILYLASVCATLAAGGKVHWLDVLVIVLLFVACLLNLGWQTSEDQRRALASALPSASWWPQWDDGTPVDVTTPFDYEGRVVSGLLLERGAWHLIDSDRRSVATVERGDRVPRPSRDTVS